MNMKTILLAGGAGYIGSHTAVELLNSGYDVVVVDNYRNSCPESIRRVEKITGKKVKLYEADFADKVALDKKTYTTFRFFYINGTIKRCFST